MNYKNNKVITLVGIMVLIATLILTTYAFFQPHGLLNFFDNIEVASSTTDLLTFNINHDISFTVTQAGFASGGQNQSGESIATATLTPNNNTGEATMNYYMYLNLNGNSTVYSEANAKNDPELMLQVFDGNNQLVNIPNLGPQKTIKGVTGYDITGVKGIKTLLNSHSISASNNNPTIENWRVVITLVNLDVDQVENTGKIIGAEIIIGRDESISQNSKYTITFNSNTGNGTMESQEFENSIPQKLSNNSFTKENYYFANWNTKADGSGDVYANRQEIDLTSLENGENLELFAIWTKSLLKSYSWNSASDFHSSSLRNTITEIEFVDLNKVTVPSINNTTSWDISAAQDESVVAWLDNNKLFIGGYGGIIANQDSKYLFYDLPNVTSINFNNLLNTSNTTNMDSIFRNCISLTSLDLTSFDTSNVTKMTHMFSGSTTAGDLDGYIWNAQSNMALSNIDLHTFDTHNVTDMRAMFANCGELTTIDVSNFDTRNVTMFDLMFKMPDSGSPKLSTITFGNSWDTKNAISMAQMFLGDKNVNTLDLTNFDTRNVTNMYGMFANDTNLKTVYVSDNFTTKNVTNSQEMFANDTNIIGGNGTTYNSSYRDAKYAKADWRMQKGYFTYDGSRSNLVPAFDNIVDDFKSINVSSFYDYGRPTASYSFLDLSIFSGKTIKKIGIPVRKVSAIDNNQTFTVKVFKNTVSGMKGSPVATYQLKIPQVELGSNKNSVNQWIYVDCNIVVGNDETLAFFDANDTVMPGYYNGYKSSDYSFYDLVGTADYSGIANASINIMMDVLYEGTFIEVQRSGQLTPNVRDVFSSDISTFYNYGTATAPYSFVDYSLFSNKNITRIGIPVRSVSAIDNNQIFTVKVFNTSTSGMKGEPVATYQLKLPQSELGNNKDAVNKWIYVDCDIKLGPHETLAFFDKNDTVIPGFVANGYNYSKFNFYDRVGTSNVSTTTSVYNIMYDIYANWVERVNVDDQYYRLKQELYGKKISILGDSISTFKTYNNNTNSNENIGMNIDYYTGSNSDITNVNKTWWMQTINKTGMNLLVNSSSGASRVFGRGGLSTDIDQGIGIRATNLHSNNGTNPDIIVVYMGTNDAIGSNPVGTYSNSLYNTVVTDNGDGTYNYISPTTFAEAYIIMMHKIMIKYPNADIYCMTLLPNGSVNATNLENYNNIIRQVVSHYNLSLVDLYSNSGITYSNYANYLNSDNLHPKVLGMNAISKTLLNALNNNYINN